MICRLMLQAERRGPEPRYNPLPALVNVVGSCSSTCAGWDLPGSSVSSFTQASCRAGLVDE